MGKHSVLNRQLRRCNLSENNCPSQLKQWHDFLERVNRAYLDLDQERYLSERSLAVSSREMRSLLKAIEEKQIRLQTIIENVNDGIIVINIHQEIESLNSRAAIMLGFKSEELVGKKFTNIISDSDRSHNSIINYFEYFTNKPYIEISGLHKDGYLIPIEITLSEVNIKPDKIFVCILRDISERKRVERVKKELHEKLVTAARLTGMGEVATSILHNVGNVLNSVSVSSTVLKEKLSKDRLIFNIHKINSLLANNQQQGFFSDDEQGKMIVEYLLALEQLLINEKENINSELESLLKNIEHIKGIVCTQQSLAKDMSGLLEPVNINDLIEKSIEIVRFDPSYDIERHYELKETILIDKIKLSQILVNIIRNCKQAVETIQHKKIVINTTTDHKTIICIEVIDNGIGIKPEVLSKIFSFGFTTRPQGHGYGLHASFLMAKEMGGTMRITSKGQNQGAKIILELPYLLKESTNNGRY
jgi:PAS domain S-box-containing protein